MSTDSNSKCVQTIFSAMDFLKAWIIKRKKAAAMKKGKTERQTGKQGSKYNRFGMTV